MWIPIREQYNSFQSFDGYYFHGAPEIQGDGLHTLYLMNPGGYADAVAPVNALLFSSTANLANSMDLASAGSLQPSRYQQEHFVDVLGGHDYVARLSHNLETAAARSGLRKGLSLTLSPHAIAPASTEIAVVTASSGVAGFLMGSKYSNAARQLLDEIVSVGSGTNGERLKGAHSRKPARINHPKVTEESESAKRVADLTTMERQELLTKKTKLADMLDEAEQRHSQYRHQMQIVVAKLEEVAGQGSARTYTRLAVGRISKQFRSLREAISGQIRAIGKSLGEEDEAKSQGSRLRFIDHHLRRQRALRHLGMLQHNPWRPQRGLPERSVAILRAWLFEHFLHPYPKDSDKFMLAKQTGLTRSQVSNWFINARVRLWKPMVEEMYLEENKDQEQSHANENASKTDANGSSTSKPSSPTPTGDHQKQPLAAAAGPSATFYGAINGGGDYGGAYTFGELGRFEAEGHFAAGLSGSGVSLTLGLQHGDHASVATAQPPFLTLESMQLEGGPATGSEYCSLNNTAAAVSSNSAFRTIDRGLLMNYYYQTL